MLKEFKAFAVRGNVLDLAIGIIIGAAFTTVVNSFVGDVIMRFIAAIFGQPDYGSLKIDIGRGAILYGSFLTTVLNFLIVALVLFLMMKAINRFLRPKGASEETPTMRECPYCKLSISTEAVKCRGCTSDVEPIPA